MCGVVYRRHCVIGPCIACFDVVEDVFFSESVTDGWFVAGVDSGAVDMELCCVKKDAGDFWAVLGMDRLIVNGLMIGVAVELCIEGKIFVVFMVVLVAFNVGYFDSAGKVLDGPYGHVYNIPVSVESAVGKALFVWSGGGDTLDEGVIVAAQLKSPFGPAVAEYK